MPSGQQPVVAYQGEQGAYSEIASRRFFPGARRLIPCVTFDLVFQRVQREEAAFGVIPIENSLAGSIHQNYDLLLRYRLTIVGELKLRIVHHLIANSAVPLSQIRRVFSHPQALMQCRRNTARLGKLEIIPTYDTAGSVKKIKEEKILDGAAIASELAARLYGMTILRENLQDNAANFTRFLLLAKGRHRIPDANKTSIVFSIQNLPGALFRSMSVFALRDIDLYKIESRPLHGKPWEYLFYVDFAGSLEDRRCRKAMAHLRELAGHLKILGSYPRDESESDR
jgi:prephenate dehydratase